PSFGIDLVTVVRHCLAAGHRRFARDVALALLAAATIVLIAYHHSGSGGPLAILLVAAAFLVTGERWVRGRIVGRLARPGADLAESAHFVGPRDPARLGALALAETGNVTRSEE